MIYLLYIFLKKNLYCSACKREMKIFFSIKSQRSFVSSFRIVLGALEIISLSIFKSMKCMVIHTQISDGKLIAQFIHWLISWCYN